MKHLAMCESILLTVREIAREQDNAVVAFHQPGGPDGDLELGDYVKRYDCRAQVRKVVEWMKGHSSAPFGESRRMTVGQNDILLLHPNAQALKAAGEGK